MSEISSAILSRSRPLFLRDYLKSLKGVDTDTTVFWMGDGPNYDQAYADLAKMFGNVRFVRQEGDMSDYMRGWLRDAGEYVFVNVDDNICGRAFDTHEIAKFMDENPDVWAFNLGLDPNIRACPDMSGCMGKHERRGDFIVYWPSTCDGFWKQEYVFSVASTIYRKADFMRIWERTGRFRIPNELEVRGRAYAPRPEKMACLSYAPISNIHVDSVWPMNMLGVKKPCTNEEALELYRLGYEIDVERTFQERDRLGVTNVMELFLKPK